MWNVPRGNNPYTFFYLSTVCSMFLVLICVFPWLTCTNPQVIWRAHSCTTRARSHAQKKTFWQLCTLFLSCRLYHQDFKRPPTSGKISRLWSCGMRGCIPVYEWDATSFNTCMLMSVLQLRWYVRGAWKQCFCITMFLHTVIPQEGADQDIRVVGFHKRG